MLDKSSSTLCLILKNNVGPVLSGPVLFGLVQAVHQNAPSGRALMQNDRTRKNHLNVTREPN